MWFLKTIDISWTDSVKRRNITKCQGGKEHPTYKVTKEGSICRTNRLLKYIIEGKLEERIEVKRRRGWRHKKVLDDLNPLNAELNPIRRLLALVGARHIFHVSRIRVNPLNAELNPIRHLLALVGARHIVHVSRIRVKETRGYCKLKEETLDLAQWRTCFGRPKGPVASQNDDTASIAPPFVPPSKCFSITVKWGHISLWFVKKRVS